MYNNLPPAAANALAIETELMWLDTLFRLREYQWKTQRVTLTGDSNGTTTDELAKHPRYCDVAAIKNIDELQVPGADEIPDSPYSRFISHYDFSIAERLALILSLLPQWTPGLLDEYARNFQTNKTSTCVELGLAKAENGSSIATWSTLFFLAGGTQLLHRAGYFSLLDGDHFFYRFHVLHKPTSKPERPPVASPITPEKETLELLTAGIVQPPEYNGDFPAKRVTTEMTWNDLVLSSITQRQVEEVKVWVRNRERLHSELGMSKRMKPGYKILFHGSPGTGKTLTACLLGQYTNKHVFRIDLSMIVSKYIGETEKNLAKVFDKAEHSDWILFFDEADALFGSRTKVSSSHDRYANQEVSYLLQRIEDYNGIVILASNMKGNIDDAFMRRFSSVVHFPFPKSEERYQLWKKAMPEKLSLAQDVDVKKLADRYEVSGAGITNIIAWCALVALENGDLMVTDSMLREGMARELAKEGRTI